MPLNKQRNNAQFHLHKLLRHTVTDSEDLSVDGSSIPAKYEYTVPSGKTAEIFSFNIDIVDGGIGFNEFGGLGSPLTNGVQIEIYDDDGTTVLLDLTDGHGIKINTHWTHFAGLAVITPAAGDDGLQVRAHLVEDNGHPIQLEEGQTFRVTVNDNLTGITHFEFMLHGMIY